jgi:hypothetical protein
MKGMPVMRVQMIGSHYAGTLVWDNGVMAGVQWDGFEGTETLPSVKISPIELTPCQLTEAEQNAGFYSIGQAVYLSRTL